MSTADPQSPTLPAIPGPAGTIQEAREGGRHHLILGISPEMDQVVEELAARHGDATKAEVFNRAVGLLKFLSDAAREGKRIGIAAPDQELETEITGL